MYIWKSVVWKPPTTNGSLLIVDVKFNIITFMKLNALEFGAYMFKMIMSYCLTIPYPGIR